MVEDNIENEINLRQVNPMLVEGRRMQNKIIRTYFN